MKRSIALPIFLLLSVIILRINPVYAASSGYERYQDDKCEVYLEYFPTVPYDTNFPTASEEFPIKFYVYQDDWNQDIYKHFVPDGFMIEVAFRDDTTEDSDWVEWKRWYPISMDQYGQDITWSLAGGYGPVSVSATVTGPDLEDVLTDYTKYEMAFNGETYTHVGTLDVYYPSNHFWGSTYAEGGGSIGIPNDLAVSHEGNHIKILVKVTLYWINYAIWPDSHMKELFFVLGDDIPTTTDCWLTVEEGTVAFGDPSWLAISAGSGGTTNPTPGSYVYDEGTFVTVAAYANAHYTLDYWVLDGATAYDNPITVAMDSNHNLNAYFSFYNNAPNTPSTPSGQTTVYRNVEYTYSTSTTDPDGDNVQYQFEFTGPSLNVSYTMETGSITVMWENEDPLGTYQVRVRAQDVYEEWSYWSPYLTVNLVGIHNVAVTNVVSDKTTVGQTYLANVSVTVENQGEYAEQINVTLYADSIYTYTVETKQVTLSINESRTLTYVWDTYGFPYYDYTLSAEAQIIGYSDDDPTDNSMTDGSILVTIAGDVDGDHDVDIYDIVIMSSAYGTIKGEPGYVPNCDIDNDGDIDIFDIVIANGNYGQSW